MKLFNFAYGKPRWFRVSFFGYGIQAGQWLRGGTWRFEFIRPFRGDSK